MVQNQDNVSEWGDMSIRVLFFQWASTIKIQLSMLVWYKVDLIIISLKINLFSPWYRWKIEKQHTLSLLKIDFVQNSCTTAKTRFRSININKNNARNWYWGKFLKGTHPIQEPSLPSLVLIWFSDFKGKDLNVKIYDVPDRWKMDTKWC